MDFKCQAELGIDPTRAMDTNQGSSTPGFGTTFGYLWWYGK
jgi:hypothetical protein